MRPVPGDLVETLRPDPIALRKNPRELSYAGHMFNDDVGLVIAVVDADWFDVGNPVIALVIVMGRLDLGWIFTDNLIRVPTDDDLPLTEAQRCKDPLLRDRIEV